mgnify:CR=1 FL=1
MHIDPVIQALRKAQEDETRFSRVSPLLQKTIRSALSEFETIFRTFTEHAQLGKVPGTERDREALSDYFNALLQRLFVLETLGEQANSIGDISNIAFSARLTASIMFKHEESNNGHRN